MNESKVFSDVDFVKTALRGMGLPYGYPDDYARPVHVTPYDGAYGNAGYVITINGSPPLTTFLLQHSGRMLVGITTGGRSRYATEHYGNKYLQTVRAYLVKYINSN